MKKKIASFIILLLVSVFSFGEGNLDQGYDLTVRIDNIREVTGEMQLGLYNKAKDFPKLGKQYKLVIRRIGSKVFTYTFHDLPAGEYALAVFQDKDSNGKINKNFLRIPTEPYGFSNNIKPKLSAPPFEKTRFRLAADTTVSITLFH